MLRGARGFPRGVEFDGWWQIVRAPVDLTPVARKSRRTTFEGEATTARRIPLRKNSKARERQFKCPSATSPQRRRKHRSANFVSKFWTYADVFTRKITRGRIFQSDFSGAPRATTCGARGGARSRSYVRFDVLTCALTCAAPTWLLTWLLTWLSTWLLTWLFDAAFRRGL